MGKKMPQQDSQLQNGNSGKMTKIMHALNRRHRWHNSRKVLPNKRQGSGKHIIDGGASESTTNTAPPPEVNRDHKKKNSSSEPAAAESSGSVSKSSKKFRIKSLISDEMSKRRGKQKNSSSSTHDPSSKQRKSTEPNGEIDPSTIRKRKCDICAAMLTVSYLKQHQKPQESIQVERQQKDAHLHPRRAPAKSLSFPQLASTRKRDPEVEELKHKLRDCKDLETTKEKFIKPMNQWMNTGVSKPMLTRPASFRSPTFSSKQKENKPTNQPSKLKQKLGLAVKESKKEKRMILMDAVFHKIPYGRRSSKDPKQVKPEKIKSSSTGSSKMDQSSTDKAHLKKTSSSAEAMSKYRWLLHKTPKSKDEKNHHTDHKPKLCVAEPHSGATNERKTLKRVHSVPDICPSDFTDNQEFPIKTPMDIHLRKDDAKFGDQIPPDHFVFAGNGNVSTTAVSNVAKGTSKDEGVDGVDRNTSHHQEKIDHQNKPSAAIKTAATETKPVDKEAAVDESLEVDQNASDHQEKIDHQKAPSAATTKLVDKDEVADENAGVGRNTSDHQETFNHQKQPSAATETARTETKLVDKDEPLDENHGVDPSTPSHQEKLDHQMVSGTKFSKNEAVDEISLGAGLNTRDHQEKDDHEEESCSSNESAAKESKLVDENLGAALYTSDDEEKNDHQREPSVVIETEKGKSFNDQEKVGHKDESSAALERVAKDIAVNKDEGVDRDIEDCQDTLNHQEEEEEESASNSGSEAEWVRQDSVPDSPFLIELPNSPSLEALSDENHLFSINDQASNGHQPSIDSTRPNNDHLFSITDKASTGSQPSIDNKGPNSDHLLYNKRPNHDRPTKVTAANQKLGNNGFLHLDLESVKDNAEFQYVKEVLERSGFLENELLGEWYSSYQPIDPSLFEEVETSYLQTKNLEELDSMKNEEAVQQLINDQHLLLFDLINEALLEVHSKTFAYCPRPLTYCSKVRPMPVGCRVLEEVWDYVNMNLSWKPELHSSLDDAVSRDLAKGDGWMNLQADAELVGNELEEMLADDLLDELVFDDLLM